MTVTMTGPTARLLDPPKPSAAGGIRRRRPTSFSVYTAQGRGSYRTRQKAHAAARWVAETTGEIVSVVSERTGERWEVGTAPSIHLPAAVG